MPKRFSSDEERREYSREAMQKWRAAHPEKVEAAKPAAAERTAEWREQNGNKERNRQSSAAWRANYKAIDPEGYREHCRENGRGYRARLKSRLIAVYGGFCTCCGLTVPEFLTFDHMDGGGNKHRKAENLFGHTYFLWLWNGGELRKRIRLHCFNCNCSRGFLGYCPHDSMRV